MIGSFLVRLRSIADAVRRFVLETTIAKLAIMAAKLWPRSRLLSLLLALAALSCVALAGYAAHTVFATLSPASPTGIGAAIAAGLAGLVVLTLCAFATVAGIEAALQVADDIGRHRSGALLILAAVIASAAATAALAETETLDLTGRTWIVFGVAAALLALSGWFQRAYRQPNRRGFRDFHVDIVDARHFLTRASHGR